MKRYYIKLKSPCPFTEDWWVVENSGRTGFTIQPWGRATYSEDEIDGALERAVAWAKKFANTTGEHERIPEKYEVK